MGEIKTTSVFTGAVIAHCRAFFFTMFDVRMILNIWLYRLLYFQFNWLFLEKHLLYNIRSKFNEGNDVGWFAGDNDSVG
jgi:hypothetical protein